VSGDPVLAPGLLVRPSPVESDRFGREVVRVTIGEGAPDHHTLLAALDEVSADVLVVRYDAARVELGGLLGASRWAVLPAGALTYWEVALPFDSAPAQAGLEVRSAETLAAQDRRGVSELVRLIVHASFADYGNHYRANPLLDPSDALEGYEDWALRSLTEHPGDVLLLMHRTVPVGFATLEFGADGADVEVLLAGTARCWADAQRRLRLAAWDASSPRPRCTTPGCSGHGSVPACGLSRPSRRCTWSTVRSSPRRWRLHGLGPPAPLAERPG